MSAYGIPILGVDTTWADGADGGAHNPSVTVYVNTPDGERRVTAAPDAEGRGIDWQVAGQRGLEARGNKPEPDFVVDKGLAELCFMESVFDVACAAYYGDFESLDGRVESWL